MKDKLNKIQTELKNYWKNLSSQKRVGIIILGFFLIGITSGIIMWAITPSYKPLFSDLDETTAGKIIKKLKDEKIPYKIDKGGRRILIPEKRIYEERIKLAASGLTLGSGVGFELFDKVNFGLSEEERRINYQRALQTELERTIDKIEEIQKSRVHLVIPKEKIFEEEVVPPKASVYVKLKVGVKLKKDQIIGIQNLVASSVERLEPKNVVIIDTDGNILTNFLSDEGIVDKKLKLRLETEEYYKKKIQTFLDNILGVNNSTVRVSAILDFKSISKMKEVYKQPKGKTSNIKDEKVIIEGPSNELNGNVANMETNISLPPMPSGVIKKNKKVKYELNKEIEKTIITPGNIKKITVAVVINGDEKKYPSSFLKNLQESIAVAAGLNLKKGDIVNVKAIPFKKSITEEEKKILQKFEQREFYLTLAKEFLPALIIIILSLLISISIFKEVKLLTGRFSYYSTPYVKGNGKGNGNGKKELKEEELLKLAKENPREAAKILKAWIS